MKKFIQKTTSIFMSLAMVALIGAPAYATMADSEPEQVKPEIIESVLPDIASEKSNLAVNVQEKKEAETDIPPVCDHDGEETDIIEEENDVEEPESAKENDAEETENSDIATTPTDPAISVEDILDFIESEEIQDALEDAGADLGEVEEEIENGNYEVIYITQEEFEQMRIENALSVMGMSVRTLGEALLVLLMIPAAPIMFFVPFVGPLATGVILASPIIILGALGLTIVSPIAAIIQYKNYELEPGYEIVD